MAPSASGRAGLVACGGAAAAAAAGGAWSVPARGFAISSSACASGSPAPRSSSPSPSPSPSPPSPGGGFSLSSPPGSQASSPSEVVLAPDKGSEALGAYYDASALLRGKKFLDGASPASLAFARVPRLSAEAESSVVRRFLLRVGGYYSAESVAGRAGHALYEACAEAADQPGRRAALGLAGRITFAQYHAFLTVHLWVLLRALRAQGEPGGAAIQATHEEFQDDVERRVRALGVRVRLRKHMTALEKDFFGAVKAYDAALAPTAAPHALRDAIFARVFDNKPGQPLGGAGGSHALASLDRAAVLARYAEYLIACLGVTPEEAVLGGDLKFPEGFF